MSGSGDGSFNQHFRASDQKAGQRSTGQGPGWDVHQHRRQMERDIEAHLLQQRQEAGPSFSEQGLPQASTSRDSQSIDPPRSQTVEELAAGWQRLAYLSKKQDQLNQEIENSEQREQALRESANEYQRQYFAMQAQDLAAMMAPVEQAVNAYWRQDASSAPPTAHDHTQASESNLARRMVKEAGPSRPRDTRGTNDQVEKEKTYEKMNIATRGYTEETALTIRVAHVKQLRDRREGSEPGVHFTHESGFEIYLSQEVLNLDKKSYNYGVQILNKMNELVAGSMPINNPKSNPITSAINKINQGLERYSVHDWGIRHIPESPTNQSST